MRNEDLENEDKRLTKDEIERLEEEVEHWKHKYKSQISKMGGYKAKVAREVSNREAHVNLKENELEKREKYIRKQEEFLKNTDYDILKEKELEIIKKDEINRKKIKLDFENSKQKIKEALSNELIRWTENYDIDDERSRGYMIGINKAKKIIDENMKFEFEIDSISLDLLREEYNLNV